MQKSRKIEKLIKDRNFQLSFSIFSSASFLMQI